LESLYYLGLILEKNPYLPVPVETWHAASLQKPINSELSSYANPQELTIGQWAPYPEDKDQPALSASDALKNVLNYMERNRMETLTTHTQILIAPGYSFKIVNGMITNFHQPKSTLLLLISAFVGGRWREIYEYALANDFRFLSYGDSSLLIRYP